MVKGTSPAGRRELASTSKSLRAYEKALVRLFVETS
jgi:hypothetical protein